MHRERCPRCTKLGRDTRGDNLAVYDDGHSHCYGCGYHKGLPLLDKLRQKLSLGDTTHSILRSSTILSYNDYTTNIPPNAYSWLVSYGITPKEMQTNRVAYDPSRQLLVFPVFDGDRLVLTNSRYFGDNPTHPKYITEGSKTHYKLFKPPIKSGIYVIVEDFVSALRIGRTFNAIPLLGSHFRPERLVLSLLVHCPEYLFIWLDFDKHTDSIKLASKTRQFLPSCGTIVTLEDPKELTDKQIKETVLGSLPCHH